MNKNFRYFTAQETARPGYLRRRFAEIRKRLAEEAAAKKAANVRPIKQKEKANG